jgi:regulator of replication initiation timing
MNKLTKGQAEAACPFVWALEKIITYRLWPGGPSSAKGHSFSRPVPGRVKNLDFVTVERLYFYLTRGANLENEVILRQFEEIERKVERLIQVNESLHNVNSDLKARISQVEMELREKTEAETIYNEERTLIRSKIDSLLGRLEEISENTP